MKHLLNDLTEQEKNSIREQHTEKIKIDTSKFSKLVSSKLGEVKPINEQEKPVLHQSSKRVIEEQNSQVMAKVRLSPTEGNNPPLNLDITNKKTQSWGCLFEGKSGKAVVKLNFVCGRDENTPLDYSFSTQILQSGVQSKGKLTKEGHEMLKQKCGCDAYVKSSNTGTGSYV